MLRYAYIACIVYVQFQYRQMRESMWMLYGEWKVWNDATMLSL